MDAPDPDRIRSSIENVLVAAIDFDGRRLKGFADSQPFQRFVTTLEHGDRLPEDSSLFAHDQGCFLKNLGVYLDSVSDTGDFEELGRVEAATQAILRHLVDSGFPVTQEKVDAHPSLWQSGSSIEWKTHFLDTQKVKARDQAQRLDGEWSHPKPQSKPRL